ncbi:hypothetical protein [Streptomyces sp. NPDC059928]|uniref:hypothetical protein n=1 Tax=unclassified Streptomyces TaxID=2593676 RepID=UPI00364F7A1B
MSATIPQSPEMLAFLDFTLTVSNPPGGAGPLTLSALHPVRLATSVTQFPPGNQHDHLQAPTARRARKRLMEVCGA